MPNEMKPSFLPVENGWTWPTDLVNLGDESKLLISKEDGHFLLTKFVTSNLVNLQKIIQSLFFSNVDTSTFSKLQKVTYITLFVHF